MNNLFLRDDRKNDEVKLWLTYLCFIVILLSAILLSSCDSHDVADRSIHVGDVLCDDHSTMSVDDYLQQDRVRCVGVVYALANVDHGTLVVMLEEVRPLSYCDTLLTVGAGTNADTFDGYQNTVAMATGKGLSPLASYALESHTFSQSDYIPSCGELRLLSASALPVNAVMMRLKERHPEMPIDLLDLSSDDGGCWYWSSTQDVVNTLQMAYVVSMATGGYLPAYKTKNYPSRLVVTLNY